MLRFEGEGHRYFWCGQEVPSVTTILNVLSSFSHINAAVLAAAGERGTKAHKACELYDADNLDEDTLDPQLKPYLAAWIRFKRETGAEIIAVEKKVYHNTLGYAGTLDRLLILNGRACLADIKTGQRTIAHGPQTEGYALALDEKVNDTASIYLRNDGTYRLEIYDKAARRRSADAFLAALTLYNYRRSHV